METSHKEKVNYPSGLRIMEESANKKKKKASSGNFLNIRVDLDSRKFDGPLREKIRTLVREEIMRTFNLICSHCNRRYNYDEKQQPSLFLVGSSELTDRQKEVMEQVVQRKSDRQISRILPQYPRRES